MKIVLPGRDVLILLTCFILSRLIIKLSGVSFGYDALFSYWQYLDVQSLQTNLLSSLWYQHAQPPFFNFLIAIVLKVCGHYAPAVFESLFLALSCMNALLLLKIVKQTTASRKLALIISLIYIVSPATILFENELFYTSFITMLLLLIIDALIALQHHFRAKNAALLCFYLAAISLTKSVYHLLWLCLVVSALLFLFYRTPAFKKMLLAGLFSILAVTGWYGKNFFLFGSFSVSSWTGMNFARIVFHEQEIRDSSNIASIPPFYPIKYYNNYIPKGYEKQYAGWNDKVLLDEAKNDSFHNLNHVGYLQVSDRYMEAGLNYVKAHPLTYLEHLATSFIIFFTPSSSYFRVQMNARKLWMYDLLYSFNLSHLTSTEEGRKLSLAISAIPKFLAYLLVFVYMIKDALRQRQITAVNFFAVFTILFVLGLSTLFDYGENMRFRYEVEPLFLVLAAQVIRNKQKMNSEANVLSKLLC